MPASKPPPSNLAAPTPAPVPAAPVKRGILLLAGGGALLALGAFLSYFLLAPRWPDLRDSGLPNVLLAGAGAALSGWGFYRSLRSRRRRVVSAGLLLLSVLSFGVLTFYIYWLSYQLPSTEGVIQIGAPAPSFRLPDQSGRERSLEEAAGRPIFLVYFRGHW
jgi:hypothetical protein